MNGYLVSLKIIFCLTASLLIVMFLQGCKFSATTRTALKVENAVSNPPLAVSDPLGVDNISLPSVVPNAFYVSPTGDDAAKGTKELPWKTVQVAIYRLVAGDTLYLRQGTYWESNIKIDNRGTSSEHIQISNYPGELVVIDGGLKDFRKLGNSDWQVINLAKNLYRSKKSYSLSDVAGKFEYEGLLYGLTRYEDLSDISSSNEFVGTGHRYVGPGVYYEPSSGKIYVRLQPSSRESLNGVYFGIPKVFDPRQVKLFINDEVVGLNLDNSAAYLDFKGFNLINFYHGARMYDSHDVSFKNMTITMNYAGIVIDPGSHHVLVDNLVFNGLFPKWVAWTDMKGSDGQYQPVPTIKPVGVTGTGKPLIYNIEIKNSAFNGVFDGHTMDGYDINIHHNTYEVSDDMIQLGTNSYNVEIHHNLIMGPGPSHNGRGYESEFPGTKYIHHNVIDATHPILWGRKDPSKLLHEGYSGWQGQVPFPTHKGRGLGKGDPWKIYHNTVIQRGSNSSAGMGFELWKGVNSTGQAHEVFNNIFIQNGNSPIVDDQSMTSGSQLYDANIYYRSSLDSPYYLFDDIETNKGSMSFRSLADFINSDVFEESRAMYRPRWDNSSIEADPRLVNPSIGNYRPSTSSPAINAAVDFGTRLPGLKGETFIGALDPKGIETVGKPLN